MAKYSRDSWTDADVRCPFYLSDDRKQRSLNCEGYCEGCETRTKFPTLRERDRHMGRYCAGRFERCPMYGLIYSEKYAEDGERA